MPHLAKSRVSVRHFKISGKFTIPFTEIRNFAKPYFFSVNSIFSTAQNIFWVQHEWILRRNSTQQSGGNIRFRQYQSTRNPNLPFVARNCFIFRHLSERNQSANFSYAKEWSSSFFGHMVALPANDSSFWCTEKNMCACLLIWLISLFCVLIIVVYVFCFKLSLRNKTHNGINKSSHWLAIRHLHTSIYTIIYWCDFFLVR